MKYKILIVLIISIILSGCINPIDDTGNFSKLSEEIKTPNKNIPAKIIKISTHEGYMDDQQFDIFLYHITEDGSNYTCFTVNNNPKSKSITCTRDNPAVI